MASRRGWALLLVFLLVGCANTRVVRLDTGDGRPLEYAPPTWNRSVEVNADGFGASLARLVLEVPLSLRPAEVGGLVRASTHGATMDKVMRGTLRKSYGRWCQAHQRPGDCLSLLDDGLGFSARDKLAVALGLSLDPMHESIADAVEDTLNPTFFKAVVVSALVSWAVLAAAPEPVFTKAAATMAVLMMAYVGVDAFLAIVRACLDLKAATDRATTFEELEKAGASFGRVMGTEGARVFVLAVTLAVSQGTVGGSSWLAARLPLLPGSSQAAVLSASQLGVNLAAIEQVSAVAVVEGTVVITLPPNAVAMADAASGGGDRAQKHHLATLRNEKSTVRGGPWTPRFKELFKKAGMELKDPENIVPIKGHKGPHPERYHQWVFDELEAATRSCRSIEQCRLMLQMALRKLSKEVATPGTELNRLITGR